MSLYRCKNLLPTQHHPLEVERHALSAEALGLQLLPHPLLGARYSLMVITGLCTVSKRLGLPISDWMSHAQAQQTLVSVAGSPLEPPSPTSLVATLPPGPNLAGTRDALEGLKLPERPVKIWARPASQPGGWLRKRGSAF